MSISATGYWLFEAQGSSEHCFDAGVAGALAAYAARLGPRAVYDFGCGEGKYTAAFVAAGVPAQGFDGNPSTAAIPNCAVQDLTEPAWQLPPVDFLLSLEVAEHIPKGLEAAYVQNLDKHVNAGGRLVLSWAVEGQGGLGHVNCRNNDYVVALFGALGYKYLSAESEALRSVATLPWFRNTIMVFHKRA